MEKYSHGPFEITGYQLTIESPEKESEVIMTAWKKWFTEDMGSLVQDAEAKSMHAVSTITIMTNSI